MAADNTEIHRGLAGVVVDTSDISSVDPAINSLLYRGYPAQELAEKCSFEEVAYLLWHGELPSQKQLDALTRVERGNRILEPLVRSAVDLLPDTAHPVDVMRTAVSVIGASHPLAGDSSPEAELAKAIELWSALPAVVAYDQRRRHGLEPVEPREDLDYSANFLWMTHGSEPDPKVVNAFRVSMILYAEHTFNASTFTARVITSTLSDLHSAVTGAIGALKGPLHGGANEAVMAAFSAIRQRAEPDAEGKAIGWLEEELAAKHKIMGFGHRVYRNGDSRVPSMKGALDEMLSVKPDPELSELYEALEAGMLERKNIQPNLDYPAGPAYHLMGFDTPMFTSLFVASRITGWTAHIMEQRANNSLIRPLSQYTGPAERHLKNA